MTEQNQNQDLEFSGLGRVKILPIIMLRKGPETFQLQNHPHLALWEVLFCFLWKLPRTHLKRGRTKLYQDGASVITKGQV